MPPTVESAHFPLECLANFAFFRRWVFSEKRKVRDCFAIRSGSSAMVGRLEKRRKWRETDESVESAAGKLSIWWKTMLLKVFICRWANCQDLAVYVLWKIISWWILFVGIIFDRWIVYFMGSLYLDCVQKGCFFCTSISKKYLICSRCAYPLVFLIAFIMFVDSKIIILPTK